MRFTRDNAKEFSAKGNAIRWSREKSRREADAIAEQNTASPREIPDTFTAERLARVRKQLNRIDRMIEQESDPQKLDRLAAASMRLNDQEFALANRPKPGNYKPTTQKQAKRAYTQIPQGWQPPPPAAPPSEFS